MSHRSPKIVAASWRQLADDRLIDSCHDLKQMKGSINAVLSF